MSNVIDLEQRKVIACSRNQDFKLWEGRNTLVLKVPEEQNEHVRDCIAGGEFNKERGVWIFFIKNERHRKPRLNSIYGEMGDWLVLPAEFRRMKEEGLIEE